MYSLSVGQVSALIAAGTASLQLLLPLAIPLILIAFISKRHGEIQQTAVTWSALGRTLHSTYWPTILGSDSAASNGVSPAVVVTVYLGIFATVLIAATAVITPLGLYDVVVPSELQRVSFSYTHDLTPFGLGTLPRNDMGFNRICGGGLISCPHSNFSVLSFANDENFTYRTEWPSGYWTNISMDTQKLWQSGLDTMESSVSSMFDIQWRSYDIRQQNLSSILNRYNSTIPERLYDDGSPYLVGGYRQVQSLLSSNGFQIIEGLIVDTDGGGIGFRNHTIPSRSSYGTTWKEDILFVIPETKCVDNNLTFQYDLKEDGFDHTLGPGGVVRLIDRGGFADLNGTVNLEGFRMNSSQDQVRLHDRAQLAAWYINAYTMLYMNLTDLERMREWRGHERPVIGTSYLFEDESNSTLSYGGKLGGNLPKPGRIGLGRLGLHLDVPSYNASDPVHNKSLPVIQNSNPVFNNPHNVSNDNFAELEWVVQGRVDAWSLANISNIALTTGSFFPPPKPAGRELNPFDRGRPGDVWTQQMFTCVSASRATIKSVVFSYNGTGALSDLHVVSAKEKQYSNASLAPLWGVEDSGIRYNRIAPFWGLLSPEAEGKPNVSTIRRESLWLPGAMSYYGIVDNTMNIPGTSFYNTLMSYIYTKLLTSPRITGDEVHDYTGYGQMALYQKWLKLGQTATRSADIINLIWTDMAANAVVGTRGRMCQGSCPAVLEPRNQGNSTEAPNVTVFERKIRYRTIYAIPAILLLVLTSVVCCAVITLLLLRRTGLDRMRWFLNQTSLGRNFTALLYPEVTSQQATRKTWAKQDAHRMVIVASERPRAGCRTEIEMHNQLKEEAEVLQHLTEDNNTST